MKKFKQLNMNEQHREKGRFKPVVPRNVPNVATASTRPVSDSADVKLKEEAGDSVNMDAPVGSQHREGDSPAARTMREKPQSEPMKKYKEIKEQLNVATPSVQQIAKKHGVSSEEIETQLKSGMEVEKEHTTNEKHAREIALDHLNERPDYYKKLKKFVEHTQLDEGRPSQRHPLEGHDYHRKSNDELLHIAKDAHAAAEAMKGHNTQAENKYRDQANDSATVRHFRKMSGTPDWYKKKYGLKEASDICHVCGCTPCNCTHIDLEEGAFSSGALKAPKSWLDAAKKIPSTGTIRDKDEKGVYTAKTVNGKEVSRVYEESDLNEVSDQTLDKAWHGRYQQANTAKRGSPEWNKAHKSMGKIGDVMNKRTSEKLINMAKNDPEAYKKSAVASAEQDRKRGWSTEETEREGMELTEGKMGQIHADIGEKLNKHIDDYKAHGGAEHLGSKTVKTAQHISKLHGIEQKHAQKFVNDYVESRLKEAWEQPNYSQSIQARQAAADKKLPFTPDVKKTKPSTPGKKGAEYSTVRNLARNALKQQVAKMKPMKESDDSRKAEIVKDVVKSAKKKKKPEGENTFQSDPVLTSDIQKQ